MAIEASPSGAVIITGSDIPTFQLLSLAHAAALEISTGLRASSKMSLTQMARNVGVIPNDGTRPNKKKILRLTVQALREARPDYEPSTLIAKALTK